MPLVLSLIKSDRNGCKSNKINKSQDFLEDEESIASRDPRNFEKIPDSLKRQEKDNECLKIRGLVKTFGEKTPNKFIIQDVDDGKILITYTDYEKNQFNQTVKIDYDTFLNFLYHPELF